MLIVKDFCEKCFSVHWVEYVSPVRTRCHGESLTPTNTQTQYVRHTGGGMFELKPKANTPTPQPTFEDWLIEAYE